MTVAQILARKGYQTITLPLDSSLEDAVQLLTRKKVGAIVVVDAKNKVVGIISERDIVRVLAFYGPDVLFHSIEKHMTTKVELASEKSSVSDVMERMSLGRFRHIPVVRGDKYLVGVVSMGDLVKFKIDQMEEEHQALTNYIRSA